jgi:uncharacterized DUF497 family protein
MGYSLMPWFDIIWNYDDEDGNVAHISEHGISTEEVEAVVLDPISEDESESSGRPVVFGCTPSGRYICVVYEMIDDVTIYPITAFEIED